MPFDLSVSLVRVLLDGLPGPGFVGIRQTGFVKQFFIVEKSDGILEIRKSVKFTLIGVHIDERFGINRGVQAALLN